MKQVSNTDKWGDQGWDSIFLLSGAKFDTDKFNGMEPN